MSTSVAETCPREGSNRVGVVEFPKQAALVVFGWMRARSSHETAHTKDIDKGVKLGESISDSVTAP